MRYFRNFPLFIVAAVMSWIPWGFLPGLWGLVGMGVQLTGLSIMILKRKAIFRLGIQAWLPEVMYGKDSSWKN